MGQVMFPFLALIVIIPNASFGTNGTYVLRFTARDDKDLSNGGKIYFISDEVKVQVGNGNPSTTLTLSCPADQSVQIPVGQNQITVTWNDPTASSTCSGGASFFQSGGPQKNSSFSPGTYTISYQASDNCGNVKTCSFTITVTQETGGNSQLTLNCPSDIVVSAPAGDNAVTVSWTEPSASTTCISGGNGGDCSSTSKSGFSYMGTFDNSQFYISNNSNNWTGALAAAQAAGGRLAIIHNQAENDFIKQNINGEIAFIGLSDKDQEGALKWVDGSTPSYNNFLSSVNNDSGNDFAVFYPWDGKWDLVSSVVYKKYILEIPCGSGGSGNGVNITQNERRSKWQQFFHRNDNGNLFSHR